MCSCSIFMVDEGLDNGDILYQKEVNFDDTEESFESSYIKLHDEIVCLFKAHWEEIKGCSFVSYPQKVEGSFHLYKELKRLFSEIDFKYTDNVLETRKKYNELKTRL